MSARCYSWIPGAENGILVTSDYVLDETFTRLFGGSPFAEAERFCSAVLRARDAGMVRVEPITAGRFARAYRLRLRYKDKPRISFTDLTGFVVMTELGIRHVLTADAHFGTPTGRVWRSAAGVDARPTGRLQAQVFAGVGQAFFHVVFFQLQLCFARQPGDDGQWLFAHHAQGARQV